MRWPETSEALEPRERRHAASGSARYLFLKWHPGVAALSGGPPPIVQCKTAFLCGRVQIESRSQLRFCPFSEVLRLS